MFISGLFSLALLLQTSQTADTLNLNPSYNPDSPECVRSINSVQHFMVFLHLLCKWPLYWIVCIQHIWTVSTPSDYKSLTPVSSLHWCILSLEHAYLKCHYYYCQDIWIRLGSINWRFIIFYQLFVIMLMIPHLKQSKGDFNAFIHSWINHLRFNVKCVRD